LLIKLVGVLGSDNAHERAAAAAKIDALLGQYSKTWADVPALLALGTTTTVNADVARHVSALGSRDAGERESARQWLLDLLISRRKTWNDLVELLRSPTSPSWADGTEDSAPPPEFADPNFAVIDLVDTLVANYVGLTPTQRLAVALWVLHTHVYDQFQVTPRLALVSPVRRCGKTVLLGLIETLVAKPEKADAITPAAIYHLVDAWHPTLLLDEVDNLGLAFAVNGRLRAIFNSGHRKGGVIALLHRGEPRRFSTYAPLSLAAIGRLPLPQMDRSIVIEMQRYGGSGELQRFTGRDRAIDYVFDRVRSWAREVTLDADPAMPEQVRNHRQADNWRPLLAIADTFGAQCGRLAREATVEFAHMQQDEDAQVLLLHDIRDIFDARDVDRLTSVALVSALNDIEDAMWSEWRGLHGNQQPHRLSQGELARMLAPFGIRPKTIWPLQRTPASRSAKGYLSSQFEQAWSSYCDGADDSPGGTASQSSTIPHLRSV
jgi:putative DNA primase/helicase